MLGCLFVFVFAKAFYIQVINSKKLLEYSKSQIFREVKVYPNRGNIYDRNGSPLAINIQTYSIFTIPKNVKDRSTYRKLAKIVPQLKYSVIKSKIFKRTRYTWLARKILLTKDQVKKIKKIGSDYGGIYIESVPKRIYPNHELLAQTLGVVGIDNTGLSGLEYYFDQYLRGRPKMIKYYKDAKGRPVKFESNDSVGDGEDLYLSIDKEIQSIAEVALKEAVIEHKGIKGGVGVLDSSTGEILAIANYPTFDPNDYSKSKTGNRKLSFITDPFEPGSILKTLTVAAAFDHHIARPDTNYYCEQGSFRVGKHIINEADVNEKFEWLSVSEIIKYSSNIGTTKIAFDLTFPRLRETLDAFGIGKKTGIELSGESRGIFTQKENVLPISLSNISFGQGVATTGIQILAAYGAIVNNGIYHRPTLIRGKNDLVEGVQVLEKSSAKEILKILLGVVEEGTGKNAKIQYFKIAGKTSTAQRPSRAGGYKGYNPGFIGFPLNIDKKFVIYAYVEDPQGKFYYGNIVAAPIFKKIAQYMLYKNKEFSQLAIIPESLGIKNQRSFDTVTIKQAAPVRKRISGEGLVPDFIGLDKVSVLMLIKKVDLLYKEKGMGIVSSQFPKAGVEITEDMIIKIIYTPPEYE